MEKISTAIIGLGRIGQLLDEALSSATHCLTHGQAFASHPDFKIVGGVDPDVDLQRKFNQRFSAPAFSQLQDFSKKFKADLFVIAGPTQKNFEIFKQVVELRPKMILMEKPMGADLEQAREILKLARSASVSVAVNFMRRAEPGVLEIKEIISSGALGKIQKAVVTYSKGLLNNGSHFIDLMRFILGSSSHHQILGSVGSHFEGDIEPDFSIQFGNVPVYFLSADENFYSLRDIQIYGSTGSISYLRGGQKILVNDVVQSQVFRGYKFLSFDGREIPTELNRIQYFVADQISQHLKNGSPLQFDGTSALLTMEDVERVRSLCQMH